MTDSTRCALTIVPRWPIRETCWRGKIRVRGRINWTSHLTFSLLHLIAVTTRPIGNGRWIQTSTQTSLTTRTTRDPFTFGERLPFWPASVIYRPQKKRDQQRLCRTDLHYHARSVRLVRLNNFQRYSMQHKCNCLHRFARFERWATNFHWRESTDHCGWFPQVDHP